MGTDKGHEEYFNKVYDATFNAVSRYVVSKCGSIEDAKDIIQNIYARFFTRITRKGYEDIESPEAFLINIAKFECKTFYSDKKKESDTYSFSDYSDEEMVAIEARMSKHQPELEDVISDKLLAKQIFDDIMNTDKVTGRIFYLYFVCDMKLDQIAAEMELPLSTVKNKLYRTIERQRKKFKL